MTGVETEIRMTPPVPEPVENHLALLPGVPLVDSPFFDDICASGWFSDAEVSIAGWRFVEGIHYEFPPGSSLSAGGYALVCRSREEFLEAWGFPGAGIFGDYEGSLDNAGEELALVDTFDAVVDALRYEDDAPWPEAADGVGASLQRVCVEADPESPASWSGAPGEPPTPLARNVRQVSRRLR